MSITNGHIVSDEKYLASCKSNNDKEVEINVIEIEYDNKLYPNTPRFNCNEICGNGDCICNGGATECFTIFKKI